MVVCCYLKSYCAQYLSHQTNGRHCSSGVDRLYWGSSVRNLFLKACGETSPVHFPTAPSIIAPFLQRKKYSLCLKSSLRHWQQLRNLFFALLPATICNKKRLQIELCALLTIRILIANCCTRMRWICKEPSKDVGLCFFLIISSPHPFMMTYRLIPISSRSISLDSTFKELKTLRKTKRTCSVTSYGQEYAV